MYTSELNLLGGNRLSSAIQSNTSTQSSIKMSNSSCMQGWSCLSAGWTERESVGTREGIKDSAVSSRATCCLLVGYC